MAEEDRKPFEVYDLLALSLEQFAAMAWQKMGLHPDPITHKLETHLDQARLAIDIAAHLAQALEPKLDDSERRRVQSLMSDLRINYVRISQAAQKPQETASQQGEAPAEVQHNNQPSQAPNAKRNRKRSRARNGDP